MSSTIILRRGRFIAIPYDETDPRVSLALSIRNALVETMQHARATLRKIFGDIVRREGDGGPVMAWPIVCGARTAERTTAVSFAHGVLTVAVPDEAWRQQLQSFIPQYLAALNQMVTEPVSKIEFRTVQRER